MQHKTKHQVSWVISKAIIGPTARAGYVLSLFTLITWIFRIGTGDRGLGYILGSVTLMIVSLMGFYAIHKTWHKTLKRLGLLTIYPAVLALFFSIFSRSLIFAFAQDLVGSFSKIEPYINDYLDHTIPKLWTLTAIYFIIGIALLIWGYKLEE